MKYCANRSLLEVQKSAITVDRSKEVFNVEDDSNLNLRPMVNQLVLSPRVFMIGAPQKCAFGGPHLL